MEKQFEQKFLQLNSEEDVTALMKEGKPDLLSFVQNVSQVSLPSPNPFHRRAIVEMHQQLFVVMSDSTAIETFSKYLGGFLTFSVNCLFTPMTQTDDDGIRMSYIDCLFRFYEIGKSGGQNSTSIQHIIISATELLIRNVSSIESGHADIVQAVYAQLFAMNKHLVESVNIPLMKMIWKNIAKLSGLYKNSGRIDLKLVVKIVNEAEKKISEHVAQLQVILHTAKKLRNRDHLLTSIKLVRFMLRVYIGLLAVYGDHFFNKLRGYMNCVEKCIGLLYPFHSYNLSKNQQTDRNSKVELRPSQLSLLFEEATSSLTKIFDTHSKNDDKARQVLSVVLFHTQSSKTSSADDSVVALGQYILFHSFFLSSSMTITVESDLLVDILSWSLQRYSKTIHQSSCSVLQTDGHQNELEEYALFYELRKTGLKQKFVQDLFSTVFSSRCPADAIQPIFLEMLKLTCSAYLPTSVYSSEQELLFSLWRIFLDMSSESLGIELLELLMDCFRDPQVRHSAVRVILIDLVIYLYGSSSITTKQQLVVLSLVHELLDTILMHGPEFQRSIPGVQNRIFFFHKFALSCEFSMKVNSSSSTIVENYLQQCIECNGTAIDLLNSAPTNAVNYFYVLSSTFHYILFAIKSLGEKNDPNQFSAQIRHEIIGLVLQSFCQLSTSNKIPFALKNELCVVCIEILAFSVEYLSCNINEQYLQAIFLLSKLLPQINLSIFLNVLHLCEKLVIQVQVAPEDQVKILQVWLGFFTPLVQTTVRLHNVDTLVYLDDVYRFCSTFLHFARVNSASELLNVIKLIETIDPTKKTFRNFLLEDQIQSESPQLGRKTQLTSHDRVWLMKFMDTKLISYRKSSSVDGTYNEYLRKTKCTGESAMLERILSKLNGFQHHRAQVEENHLKIRRISDLVDDLVTS